MSKETDTTITTLKQFRFATQSIDPDTQIFIRSVNNGELGPLVEVTEVELVLPKEEGERPFLILRCV